MFPWPSLSTISAKRKACEGSLAAPVASEAPVHEHRRIPKRCFLAWAVPARAFCRQQPYTSVLHTGAWTARDPGRDEPSSLQHREPRLCSRPGRDGIRISVAAPPHFPALLLWKLRSSAVL